MNYSIDYREVFTSGIPPKNPSSFICDACNCRIYDRAETVVIAKQDYKTLAHMHGEDCSFVQTIASE